MEPEYGRMRRLNGHSAEVWGVDYSPNGQMIASSSEDGFVKLWNPSDGALITHMVHNAAVIPVRFGFDSQAVVSARLI